jgi:hypothetical protein
MSIRNRQGSAVVAYIVTSVPGRVAVEHLFICTVRHRDAIPELERPIVQAGNYQRLFRSGSAQERNDTVVVVRMYHVDVARAQGRTRRAQAVQILVEAKKKAAIAGALADQVFLVEIESVEFEVFGRPISSPMRNIGVPAERAAIP